MGSFIVRDASPLEDLLPNPHSLLFCDQQEDGQARLLVVFSCCPSDDDVVLGAIERNLVKDMHPPSIGRVERFLRQYTRLDYDRFLHRHKSMILAMIQETVTVRKARRTMGAAYDDFIAIHQGSRMAAGFQRMETGFQQITNAIEQVNMIQQQTLETMQTMLVEELRLERERHQEELRLERERHREELRLERERHREELRMVREDANQNHRMWQSIFNYITSSNNENLHLIAETGGFSRSQSSDADDHADADSGQNDEDRESAGNEDASGPSVVIHSDSDSDGY